MNKPQHTYFIGIDGGGSKCKAIVTDLAGVILGSGLAGPANPFHGFEQATDSIVEAAKLALADAGLSEIALADVVASAGLAGVNLPSQLVKMQQWCHPFKQFLVTTDLDIACLGAHDGLDGGIIILGTGSCGYSKVADTRFSIGGHGFPQGDKGSGAWIGMQLVTIVLRSLDEVEQPTIMSQKLLDKLHCHDSLEIVEAIAHQPASFFGELAHIAFESAQVGDSLATAIITDGANYIDLLANKLSQQGAVRLSLIGGLSPNLKPYLSPATQELIVPAKQSPEFGSVIYAKQRISQE